jgi:hypothetical protein
MAKCPWCGTKIIARRLAFLNDVKFTHRCINGCYESIDRYHTESEALAAASKRFMPKRTVEEILEPREKFSVLFTEALNSFPDKKQGECPNVFSARYASFVNYVLAVQATRIADFIYGAE